MKRRISSGLGGAPVISERQDRYFGPGPWPPPQTSSNRTIGASRSRELGLAGTHAQQRGGKTVQDAAQRRIGGHGAEKGLGLEQLLGGRPPPPSRSGNSMPLWSKKAPPSGRAHAPGTGACPGRDVRRVRPAPASASSGVAPSITTAIKLDWPGNLASNGNLAALAPAHHRPRSACAVAVHAKNAWRCHSPSPRASASAASTAGTAWRQLKLTMRSMMGDSWRPMV